MDDEEYDEWELMYGNDLEAENEMNAMEMELSTPTAAPPPKSAPVLAAPSSATVPAVVVVAADEPLEMKVDVEYKPNNLVKEVRDEDRYISRRPSLDTPSIACVLASGERVFIKKKEHEFAFEKAATNKPVQWKLGSSIKTLLESINQRAIEAVVEADRRREENQGGEHAVEAVKESDLWLNKYSPRHFIDLLSDERTNREVLTWLKSWDPVVFPSKSSKAPSKALPDQLKPPNADIRPEHKIILICGPPGAGKTTLASIAARHAGYNPVEINASDDRSAGVLKEKIINAMEMQAIFGNNRPNCIILDEIDGAMGGPDGKGAISAIQALIAAPYSSRTKPSKQQHAAASNKKAAGGQHPVIRPIICICNDQFAPVLRPLRRLAKIFVMHTPDPRQLMQRMKFICKQENIRASNSLLSTLCDRADNDVRFCLNALQFASARTSAALTVSMIDSMMGRKDVSKGAFDVWDTVFFESKEQQKDKSNACMRVCDTADRFGSHELILHGLHDNLLPLVFNDPTLTKINHALEWMEFADLCDTKVKSHQQFALLAYCSMAAVAVYRACCTSSRRRIEYPKAHYDHRKHVETSQSIMDAFVGSGVALRLGRRVLAVDVVSSVVAMLNPVLTPSQDKQPMDQLIARMASLQLSYKQIQMPGGVVEYLLEPSLDRLVQYKALEPRVRLPLGVRQTMAREVDLENMRRADKGSRLPDDVAAPDVGIVDVDLEDAVAVPDASNPFGLKKRKREAQSHANAKRWPVRFKFNEGFTSGIKRPVLVQDLL
ncbi:hypothetical protein H257_16207 [Aphanomyces astaci]|uniref:AAA+ ATPase domain-containing protein n=1 Tax=Aphanomyces astaci TaxID=112090 RepID=W4FLC8_APHAT|nr:hypothetical protein H257_16207 [Aphanomyces astaci]ETV67609.1 hypothetical protein H257_16207 [Aphanomyces astaci]|eukprot:XP_009842866.1 hypothetical protein H257_16207 [Aphanomyces astaci]